jgi:hypothetical protein
MWETQERAPPKGRSPPAFPASSWVGYGHASPEAPAPGTGLDHGTLDPPARLPRARDRFFLEERIMSRFSSFEAETFTSLGTTNIGWGVCGFTSVCYAVYATHPGYRGKIINAREHYTMLASIKTFLSTLKARGEFQLLREIEEFNKTFGVKNFSIQNYINRINNAEENVDFFRDKRFGIAMPPDAVAKYLETWGYEAKVLGVNAYSQDPGGNAIIGVKKVPRPWNSKLTMYNRLCHWMYRYNGKIYSWGEDFNTVKDADPSFEVCWVILMR